MASATVDACAGFKDPTTSVTADAGIAVSKIAFKRWHEDGNTQRLPALIRESLDQLSSVFGA